MQTNNLFLYEQFINVLVLCAALKWKQKKILYVKQGIAEKLKWKRFMYEAENHWSYILNVTFNVP